MGNPFCDIQARIKKVQKPIAIMAPLDNRDQVDVPQILSDAPWMNTSTAQRKSLWPQRDQGVTTFRGPWVAWRRHSQSALISNRLPSARVTECVSRPPMTLWRARLSISFLVPQPGIRNIGIWVWSGWLDRNAATMALTSFWPSIVGAWRISHNHFAIIRPQSYIYGDVESLP